MNHLPFEDWLLTDMLVTPEQRRELDLHLRDCSYCSALAETGRLLHTTKLAAPVPGFTSRFQARLVVRKAEDRRRRLWGTALFTLGGLALLMWLIAPHAVDFLASPAAMISMVISWFVFLGTTLSALLDASLVSSQCHSKIFAALCLDGDHFDPGGDQPVVVGINLAVYPAGYPARSIRHE